MEYFDGNAIELIGSSSKNNGVDFDEPSRSGTVNYNAFHATIRPLWKSHFQQYATSGVMPSISDHAPFDGDCTQTATNDCRRCDDAESRNARNVVHHQAVVDGCVFRLARLAADADCTMFISNDCDANRNQTLNFDRRRLPTQFDFGNGNFECSLAKWGHDDANTIPSPGATSDSRSVTSSTSAAAVDYSQMTANRCRQAVDRWTTGENESSLFCRWGSSPPLRLRDVTPSSYFDTPRAVDVSGARRSCSSDELFGENKSWTHKMASMWQSMHPLDTVEAGLRNRERFNYHEQPLLPSVFNSVDINQFQQQRRSLNDTSVYTGESFVDSATTPHGADFSVRLPPSVASESFVHRKPKDALVPLIGRAIISNVDCRMSLADICRFIGDQSADYRPTSEAGGCSAVNRWQNNVRHTLSHYEFFVKSGRLSTGRGNYWTVHAVCRQRFAEGDFRIKRARHAVQIYEKNIIKCGKHVEGVVRGDKNNNDDNNNTSNDTIY